MFPLGFIGLAFGLFLIDSAIKKRPVVATLKELITNPTGYREGIASMNNTTFQEPIAAAATTSADLGLAVGGGSGAAEPAVQFALAQVGKRYRLGATGPNEYDCSGLTEKAYAKVGVGLPHYSTAQAGFGKAVDPNNQSAWVRGDLLFPHPGHVAIYLGGGQVVEAMNPRDGIRVNPAATSYWRVRRMIK